VTAAENDPQGTPAAGARAAAPPSAHHYPMCGGQHVPNAGAVPHGGESGIQLAPAYIDEMPACAADDALPVAAIPPAEGHINAKGDCEFPNGVSCHYHSGAEFITTGTASQIPGQGELHCIVPTEDPKSPHVFGAHIECRNHAQGEVHGEAPHDVHAGEACGAAIVRQLAPCIHLRCCDEGTLTSPIEELVHDHRNDIRPDFRICEDTLEVDCELLESYTAHHANCPALGGVMKQPVFAVSHH
jgi:hypothetical protein